MRDRARGHGGPHALGGGSRGFETLLREYDDELLAPVAVNGVAGATAGGQRAGDGAQRFVSAEVALGVVERLEHVHVE